MFLGLACSMFVRFACPRVASNLSEAAPLHVWIARTTSCGRFFSLSLSNFASRCVFNAVGSTKSSFVQHAQKHVRHQMLVAKISECHLVVRPLSPLNCIPCQRCLPETHADNRSQRIPRCCFASHMSCVFVNRVPATSLKSLSPSVAF